MTKSIYDQIDLLEDAASNEETLDQDNERDLGRMKEELSSLDDTISELEDELEDMVEKFRDEELSMADFKEFFTGSLPDMIASLSKTRERLY